MCTGKISLSTLFYIPTVSIERRQGHVPILLLLLPILINYLVLIWDLPYAQPYG